MKELIIFLTALAIGVFLIYRMARRGISKKYERKPTKEGLVTNSWSALNEGVDPSL
jgi:hypothetical protein